MNLKRLKYTLLGICAVTLMLGQASRAQDTYVYTQAQTERGERDLRLDFYAASQSCESPRPTVVFVHPGAFRAGNRKDILARQFQSVFRPYGFNVVSIDYRLIRQKPILSPAYVRIARQFSADDSISDDTNAATAAFEDTVAALTYLSARASELCIDSDKVILAGASAGAIVVLNVAYSLDAYGIEVPRLAAVVSLWGGFMPDRAMSSPDTPILVVHGKKDPIIPHSHADQLWAQALETRTPIQFFSFANARHGVQISRRVGQNRLVEYIREFSTDVINGQQIQSFRIDG